MKSVLLAVCCCFLLVSTVVKAEEHIVQVITDNENGQVVFSPKTLTIKAGDTVKWINQADDQHNVITYPDGYPVGGVGFSSPFLETKGQSWSFTFTKSGTYQYHCIPHIFMGMRGVIIVDTPSLKTGFHKPSPAQIVSYRDKLLAFYDDEEIGAMPEVVKRNTPVNP
ncbi:MAG: cupredoxin domain-containing protein [Kordiimonadaceae bacterium]|nr:cupredoxin domain-containing protein [Kordiimonadaceae bacterium]